MQIDLLNNLANPQNLNFDSMGLIWTVIKWMVVLGLLIYTVFAAVVIKQVSIMSETIEDPANGIVKLFSWGHLALAIFVTVMVILVL